MNQIFPASSRWTRLFLLACLAALLVTPLMAGADLEKGRQISYDILKKEAGLAPEDVTPYQSAGNKKEGYAYSYIQKNHPKTNDGCWVVWLNGDLSFRELCQPNPVDAVQRIREFFPRGTDHRVTAREVYEFVQTEREDFEELQMLAQTEREGFRHGARMLLTLFDNEILNPTEQMLPIAHIKAKADEGILALPGWTQEKLDMYPFCVDVCYQSPTYNRPVYLLLYKQRSSDDAQFAGRSYEYYERVYDQVLDKMFGGSINTPLKVVVILDAMTGEVLGEPTMDFPGNNTWQWFWGAK